LALLFLDNLGYKNMENNIVRCGWVGVGKPYWARS
jgi:hypothetical protein